MFDPTKSDSRNSVNRREKFENEKKNLNFLSSSSGPLPNEIIISFFYFVFLSFLFFFIESGTHMSPFALLGPF